MNESKQEFVPGSSDTMVSVTSDEKLWAMVVHLLGLLYPTLVGQYAGPLLVYFYYKDKSKFVAFHALQTLYYHLAILVLGAASAVLVIMTLGLFGIVLWIVGPIIGVILLVYPIIAAVKAYDGQVFEYWIVGKWARDRVGL